MSLHPIAAHQVTPAASQSFERLSDTRKVRTRHGARWGWDTPLPTLYFCPTSSGGASPGLHGYLTQNIDG